MTGLSTRTSISFGWALVAGRNRVPSPAAGKTAVRTAMPAIVTQVESEGARSGPAERSFRRRPLDAAEARHQPRCGAAVARRARDRAPAAAPGSGRSQTGAEHRGRRGRAREETGARYHADSRGQ